MESRPKISETNQNILSWNKNNEGNKQNVDREQMGEKSLDGVAGKIYLDVFLWEQNLSLQNVSLQYDD